MKLFTVAEMIVAEKTADFAGVSYAQMMETAGKHVAEAIEERYPVAEANVLVLVGPGNNGGDGLVAGRYLAEMGANVVFYLFKPRDPEQDEYFAVIQKMGLMVVTAEYDQRFRVLRTRLNITDILIDSLLGTGVSRPISGDLAQLLKQVRASIVGRGERIGGERDDRITLGKTSQTVNRTPHNRTPIVVAVDCPSGLNCDGGAVDPLTVEADLSVTFAGPKRGHFAFPGAAVCGELVVGDIGVTEEMVEAVSVDVATAVSVRALLPKRPLNGQKGTFGSLLIATGSVQYWGAPVLAARAAYRVGAGLVGLALPEKIRAVAATQLPEATYPLIEDKEILTAKSVPNLTGNMGRYKAVVVGPGLDDAPDFLTELFRHSLPPLVLDADALNILARQANWHEQLPPNCVLTPHSGEMARLMGISLNELKQMDRIAMAQEMAQKWGQIVLLKGAYTVIAKANGRCTVLPFANPILSVAGSGDVLAGLIGGLMAQGLAGYEAAVLGGYLHGMAGEKYGKSSGLLAHEIAELIPDIMMELRS